jgi:hypothetical protein
VPPAVAWDSSPSYSSDSIYAGSSQPSGYGSQSYGSGQSYGGIQSYGTGGDGYGGQYQGQSRYGGYAAAQPAPERGPQGPTRSGVYPEAGAYEQQYGDWGATGLRDPAWYSGDAPGYQQGFGQPSVYAPQYQFRQDREIDKPVEPDLPRFRPYSGAGGTDYTWGQAAAGRSWSPGASVPAPVFRPLDDDGDSRGTTKQRSSGTQRSAEGVPPAPLPAIPVDPYVGGYPGVPAPGYGPAWGGYPGVAPWGDGGLPWDPGAWWPGGDGGFPFF